MREEPTELVPQSQLLAVIDKQLELLAKANEELAAVTRMAVHFIGRPHEQTKAEQQSELAMKMGQCTTARERQ